MFVCLAVSCDVVSVSSSPLLLLSVSGGNTHNEDRSVELKTGNKANIHVVCCASRIYELRALLAVAKQYIVGDKVDAKGISVELTKFLNTFFPIHASLNHVVMGVDDGIIKLRLESVLSFAERRAADCVGTFSAKLAHEFVMICGAINSKAAHAKFFNYFEMSSAENLEKNKTDLLALSDAEESTAIMSGFQMGEALMKGIKGMKESLVPFGDNDIGKAVTAMTDSLAKVQETFMNETSVPGKLLGHCCIIQSLYRELEAGETRQILITKCQKSFAKKTYLKADPHMRMVMDQA